eukprot:CAMPEP_0172447998 /NCGR_PEP_ID=MMETSP1065-20121228/7106_1 /TAXON_ID=265537 /ORGANISM="Amphiprora paludosa, Strain CCMP125" /LENGTH=1380 /DNA_ID=CAMNT_0013199371 /DNA_START=174 /DNA_END=4316 /DNA_ORIENTATION=-
MTLPSVMAPSSNQSSNGKRRRRFFHSRNEEEEEEPNGRSRSVAPISVCGHDHQSPSGNGDLPTPSPEHLHWHNETVNTPMSHTTNSLINKLKINNEIKTEGLLSKKTASEGTTVTIPKQNKKNMDVRTLDYELFSMDPTVSGFGGQQPPGTSSSSSSSSGIPRTPPTQVRARQSTLFFAPTPLHPPPQQSQARFRSASRNVSTLWQSTKRRFGRSSSSQARRTTSRTSTTQLPMVLTTPESIIEQASTVKLLDDLIDESVRTSARRPIMMQFDPSSGWIWKRWKGTIFSETWSSCVSKMLYAMVVMFGLQVVFPNFIVHLQGFDVLWGQMLQVTTFTLTFFLNQSYALWRKCYALSRRLQGRLHDINMSLAAHAARKPPSSPNEVGSTCTAASRQVLELVSRYARLFNLLTYASFTRSHRPILTPRGMRRLVERGLLTPQEREVLVDCELPATQRHNAILLWISRTFVEAWRAGHFEGGTGFENQILEKIHVCRAQYGAIGDELSGRMPLAYAHIVQVLVDVVLWMYPLMAISSKKMSPFLAVLGTGILTLSYQGLFELAKQFLDPYDNESFGKGEDPLVVDTLIAETNAGSVRWLNGLEKFPISSQRIQEGELSEYLLPLRGISVEELEQLKKEKKERERELQERREKEEKERQLAEAAAKAQRKAAEAMIPGLWEAQDGEFMLELEKLPTKYALWDESLLNGQHQHDAILELKDADYTPETEEAYASFDEVSMDDASLAPNGDVIALEGVNGDAVSITMFDLDQQEDNFPLESLGIGVADIVNRLDDIAGGVPITLIPPDTAAAKQERPPPKVSRTPEPKVEDIVEEDVVEQEQEVDIAAEAMQPSVDVVNELSIGEAMPGPTATEEDQIDQAQKQESSQEEGNEELETEESIDTDEEEGAMDGADDYVHTFDFNSDQLFNDVLWLDQIDEDGKEIRLSQLMADEEWEEEREAAREKEEAEAAAAQIRTFEQYTQRIEEIRDASNNELAETQEILAAAPGAESTSQSDSVSRTQNLAAAKPVYYDQTKLDGISQLWGLPPGEISEEFSYQEPPLEEEDEPSFEGFMQLTGKSPPAPASRSATTSVAPINFSWNDPYAGMEEEDDFAGLGALWGMDPSELDDNDWSDFTPDMNDGLDDNTAVLSASATRVVRPPVSPSIPPPNLRATTSLADSSPPNGNWKTSSYLSSLEGPGGSNEIRLSQLLADEVWEEEMSTSEQKPMVNPVTLEDYTKQVAEILEAEKEEMEETEAILNAPAFAESLEGFDDEKKSSKTPLVAMNETKPEDDLSILEMDLDEEEIELESSDILDPIDETRGIATNSSLGDGTVTPFNGTVIPTNGDELPPDELASPALGVDANGSTESFPDSSDDDIPPDVNIIL